MSVMGADRAIVIGEIGDDNGLSFYLTKLDRVKTAGKDQRTTQAIQGIQTTALDTLKVAHRNGHPCGGHAGTPFEPYIQCDPTFISR
jgi:hypothetical protein